MHRRLRGQNSGKTSPVRMRLPVAALVLLSCLLLEKVGGITDGLLPNGNFEAGPSQADLNGTVVTNPRGIPNWLLSGQVEYIRSGQRQGSIVLVVPEGTAALRLGNEASIRQQLQGLTPGGFYAVTLGAARTCAQQERLNLSVSAEWDDFPIQTLYSSSGWDAYAYGFQASSAVTDLVVHNPGAEDDPACGPLVDTIAIRTLYPPRRTNQNLLKNGDFEVGPYILPNTSTGVLVPPELEDRHSPLPGWIVESLRAVRYLDAPHFAVPQGQRAVELVGGRESSLAQVVRTVPGRLYSLAFSVGDAGSSCPGSMVVEAFAGNGRTSVQYASAGRGGFRRAELRFNATDARTRVMFYSSFYHTRSDSTLCGPVVDDVRLLSVRLRPQEEDDFLDETQDDY